jgi:sugar transferase EpsL
VDVKGAAYDPLKRLIDVVGAAIGLGLFAVPMAVVAVLVRRKLGSPVLFAQDRPGLHGEVFRLRKFRTMRDAVGPDGQPLPDAQRLTPFGSALRAWSLDELPELWNVLRGDMSLVGPRPLLVSYLDRYSREQARRHEVRPGLTGLSQIEGRNDTTWERKLARDVWYVDHRSLRLDLAIIARTVLTVLRRDGVNQPGQATAEEFRGEG